MADEFNDLIKVQDYSLHTHTVGFDGQNTVADMIARAKELGLKSFGVSNHFIVHPEITKSNFYQPAILGGYETIYSSSFDEAIAKFVPHYNELERLADTCGIKLYRGMELDFFDGAEWLRGFDKMMKTLQPDYIICASHFVEYDGMLRNVYDIGNANAKSRADMLKLYWEKLARAAKSGFFNWMAHLNLPKKTGAGTEDCWAEYEQAAIDEIAKTKTAIEINTSGYNRGSIEPYPSSRILKMAVSAKVPVLISDDAHCAEHIGRHFERGYDFAKSCGITKFLTCEEILSKTY